MVNDKWRREKGEGSGGAEAKFLFLFKEKVDSGGSKHFQI